MPRVLYIQYTNPGAYPPLEHSSRLLADAGWRVVFLGTSVPGADALTIRPHARIVVRQLPYWSPGWRQKLHYAWFALWAIAWALRWRPRWVYASDYLSCPIALLLAAVPTVRVIYHEHDAPLSPPTGPNGAFIRLCLLARRWLANRASVRVLPNQERANRFIRQTAQSHPVLCVWNCPARDEATLPRPARRDAALCVVYHGSIVPSRLPPSVVEAVATLPDTVQLRVIGYETVGHPGYVRQLRDLARRLGIADRVQFIAAMPRQELMRQCRDCDVGLSLMPKNHGDPNLLSMVGASNKPFDYLACGAALLVSDLPDWRQLYVASGYGLACDPEEPASIAAALRWFLEHPDETRAMAERGRQQILAVWNYETQFAPVFAQLNGGTAPQAWERTPRPGDESAVRADRGVIA